MAWNNITTLCQNHIEATTAKAILLKVPKSIFGEGFVFWIPKACVRTAGKKAWYLSVGVADTMDIEVKRYGKNYNVLETKSFTGLEFVKLFD